MTHTPTLHAAAIQKWMKEHPGSTWKQAAAALLTEHDAPPQQERRASIVAQAEDAAAHRLRLALDKDLPRDGAPEEAVQDEILKALAARRIYPPKEWRTRKAAPKLGEGFVYVTSQRRRSKVTEGLSDLVVAVVGWPLCLMLEVKARGAFAVSPDQRIAAQAGTLWIVRSGAQALRLLDAFASMLTPQLNCADTLTRAVE